MVLAMTRPYSHSKTSVYWLRKVVPPPLRACLGKTELKESLRTKDPREAKAKAPAVLARFDALLAAARAGGNNLSQRDIEALCGEWYRAECAEYGDDPGSPEDWDESLSLLGDRLEDVDPDYDGSWERRFFLTPADRAEAAALLTAHGHLADPETVKRLGEALWRAKVDFAWMMKRRAGGDWSPDPAISRFPTAARRKPAETAPKAVAIESLVAAWAGETGTKGKALYDRERTAKLLTDFLGHNDAARVAAEDVVRWKEARLAAGRSTKTVANDIGELRPIWTWAKVNRKLSFTENPFAGLAPKAKRGARGARDPFTEDQARDILQAARREADPTLRWLSWLACVTGARISEIAQSHKEDFKRHDGNGAWFLHIHASGPGRTLKTPQSERMVPLHPALLREGFLDYLGSLPAGSPLFPDLRPDKFGSRGGTATKKYGRWVRKSVGIADRRKDPAHAWRHCFEDHARRAGLPQNVTDALLGHHNPMNESEGYGRGFRFMPDATAPWVAKMAPPLAHSSSASQAREAA